MKTIIRISIQAALLGILIVFVIAGYSVYENNKDVATPETLEIESAFERSVDWLTENQSRIMKNHNSALWWMLKEASEISENERLKDIYLSYETSFLDRNPNNLWTPFFKPYYKPDVPDLVEILYLREYQIFFVYALSCDDQLGQEPIVTKQLSPDYCVNHFFHPRCVTHQQMGVRLLQQRSCGNHEELSDELLDIIFTEITWDYRVTDSYFQRALMLAEGGRHSELKPVWIQRIIDAQNIDGGWDDFHPVISIAGKQIGYTSLLPGIGPRKSDFHATAQVVWLLALLIENIKTDQAVNQ